MKTVFVNLLALCCAVGIWFWSAELSKNPQAAAPLATAAMQTFPTRTLVPTATNTLAPTATATMQPTATRTPFVQPTTDTAKIVEVAKAGATARALTKQADEEAQDVAWGWVLLGGVVLAMLLVFGFFAVTFIRSLRDKSQNSVQPTTRTTQAQKQEVTPFTTMTAFGVTPDNLREWTAAVQTNKGIVQTETYFYGADKLFERQNDYRRFFGWFQRWEFVEQRSDKRYELTVAFYDWLEDNIQPTA